MCAYTCRYIDVPTGSIDHFNSKSAYPQQAYEWSNYRLCMHRVNGHKGSSVDVIDPFAVQPGWFVLDFPSCLVKPGGGIEESIRARVEATIKALKLNDDDSFVQDRCDVMLMFAQGDVALGYLKKHRPFLAIEVERLVRAHAPTRPNLPSDLIDVHHHGGPEGPHYSSTTAVVVQAFRPAL